MARTPRTDALRPNTLPPDRASTLAFGTLVASTALFGLTADDAAAADLREANLRIVADALNAGVARPLGPVRYAADDAGVEQSQTFTLSVPSGNLSEVVAELSRQASVRITLANESLGIIMSPGVTGTMTLEQAMRAILAGTGVGFRAVSANLYVLDVQSLSESVSVTGAVAVIASPKYNAPIRDIPQTIEVIPRAAMDAQGVTTLSEALRNVPGVTLQAGEGGGASSTAGDMFTMRGFNASNSLFVDNVRDDGLVARDVYNIEQVEVFMGPTGSDVGRGTAAGYVNMQTKTPHLPQAASATLTLGTADQKRATIDVNQPLGDGSSDRWLAQSAVRLNALWQDSGVAGRDVVTNASKAFAPSIGLGLSTSTRVTASAQFLKQDNVPDYGIPGAAWHDSFLVSTNPVHSSAAVDFSNYYGSPAYDYDRVDQNTAAAKVEHDVAARWTLANQTRYNRTERDAIISTVQSPASFSPATELVTVARQGNIRENQITSNQTSLNGRAMTGRIEHNISSGVEFAKESQFAPSYLAASLGTPKVVSIYAPNPALPIDNYAPVLSGAFTDGSTTTAAVYAFDSISLGPRLQVNAGLRLEHYRTEFRSVDANGSVTADLSGADNLLSGKAGIVYRVAPSANLYASYGTTVTPPGAANFSLSGNLNNQNNPNVKPQESANSEVGAKVDVADGRLSLTAAVFHTINENVLFTVDAAAVPPIYNQDDKQRVDGVALGAAGQITPEWNVLASFGYLDTESLTQNTTNNGNRLTLSPKFSGSVWSTYRLPRGWAFGGGVRATSEVYINAANTIAAPGYKIVDLLAEYAVNRHLTLRFNVYNLLDELYVRNVNNNGGRFNPGNPRTAQLTTAVSF
jgi:catecholate siderophore receptor